jgi:transposase
VARGQRQGRVAVKRTGQGHSLHSVSVPKLTRFLDNDQIPLDNNRCENAIRPFVVGRKAWLFADTQAGAAASANLYSLIETAKANGVEPHAYLARLFAELPYASTVEQFEAMLPWNVKTAQPQISSSRPDQLGNVAPS